MHKFKYNFKYNFKYSFKYNYNIKRRKITQNANTKQFKTDQPGLLLVDMFRIAQFQKESRIPAIKSAGLNKNLVEMITTEGSGINVISLQPVNIRFCWLSCFYVVERRGMHRITLGIH